MNPQLRALALGRAGVFSRRQAIGSGCTPQQIREHLHTGRWERIRHGQYAERLDVAGRPPWECEQLRHRRMIHAVMNSRRPGTVAVSHQSALLLHGLPLWGVSLQHVHLSRLDDQGGGRGSGVQEHLGRLAADDLTIVEELPVTSVPRAVVETACTTSFEAAVVVADAACREYGIGDEQLHAQRDTIEYWPGSPTARAALDFCDPLAESVGESRLRVLMHAQGLPTPVLQAEFRDGDGFVARVDFYFPGLRTVVEFDGLAKYADGSAEVLVREKSREDRLRALGLEVVRTTWADLERPERVAGRIHQAFARSRRAA